MTIPRNECRRCGRPTPNENFRCDECREIEGLPTTDTDLVDETLPLPANNALFPGEKVFAVLEGQAVPAEVIEIKDGVVTVRFPKSSPANDVIAKIPAAEVARGVQPAEAIQARSWKICFICGKPRELPELGTELDPVKFEQGSDNPRLSVCVRCLDIYKLQYIHDRARYVWRQPKDRRQVK